MGGVGRSAPGVLRLASANLELGGIDRDGDRTRLSKTLAVLRAWEFDAVLLQETTPGTESALGKPIFGMSAAERRSRIAELEMQAEDATWDHLRAIGGDLGMRVILGAPMMMSFSRGYTAILVRDEYEVVEHGPPSAPAGGFGPSWAHGAVDFGGPSPVDLYSMHLPPRSREMQRIQAEWLASLIGQRGALTIAGGDTNSLSPTDAVDVRSLAVHLRPVRMRWDEGEPVPDFSVHQELSGVDLVDAAAWLPDTHRTPRELRATGRGRGRIDRWYVSKEIVDADAVSGYAQIETGGSDHEIIVLEVDRLNLAKAKPRGYTA